MNITKMAYVQTVMNHLSNKRKMYSFVWDSKVFRDIYDVPKLKQQTIFYFVTDIKVTIFLILNFLCSQIADVRACNESNSFL
jgi:hypothetical protein